MRRLLFILLSVCVLWACTDSDSFKTKFEVKTAGVELSDLGGYCEVRYTLPAESAINAVALTDAEWIADIDNSRKGVIGFRVLPNEGEARQTVITLRHISTDHTPQITVKQSGAEGEKLTIELLTLDYSECGVRITPADEDMRYIVMMAEKSYLTTLGITNAKELADSDLAYFNTYLTGDCSLEEFLTRSNIATTGSQVKRWQELSPAREYVVYAYGIYLRGDKYDCITPVAYELIDSRLPERKNEEFEVAITAEGPEVTFDINPKTWDGYYAVQLVEDSETGYVEQGLEFSMEAETAVAEAFFYVADHLYYFEEKSAEEIMQQLGYKGDAHYTKTLNANHRYMALIYAIASEDGGVPMVVSKPIVEYFSTGTVERSDMTFDVEFSNIRPRSVDVRITPSTDEPYTAVMMYARNLPEGDKQEQLEFVEANYAPLELSGIYEEHIDQLPPETEFVLALYGYYAGAATTDLFIYRFTTAKDGVGKNVITEVKCTAYDLADVVALEPYYQSFVGYADFFLSVEVATAEPSPALHFDVFPRRVLDEYTLYDIRESLLDYSYTSSPDWALCSYGNEYVVCGLAEDERGYVGELFVSEPISFQKADTEDAAEFVELYKDYIE